MSYANWIDQLMIFQIDQLVCFDLSRSGVAGGEAATLAAAYG